MSLTNQNLELEARVGLLQSQLDRAYEELADKDNKIESLEQEIMKDLQVHMILCCLAALECAMQIAGHICHTSNIFFFFLVLFLSIFTLLILYINIICSMM